MAESAVELVMSEFRAGRQNAGGAVLGDADRLNPTLDCFLRIFPDASVALYTDSELSVPASVRTIRVDPPFSPTHQRYGWRAHDYYQAFGMLNSRADVAVAMDSDMKIVSPDFQVIALLARRFGLAVPMNPRLMTKVDGTIGSDSTYKPADDETRGATFALNLTPIAFRTSSAPARAVLEKYLQLLAEDPGRGAVHLSNACYELGFSPCVLPAAWCVCSPNDYESPHVWKNAIALHVGHPDVEPRWNMEETRSRLVARAATVKNKLRLLLK